MDKFGYVYKVTNLITGEYYIGHRHYSLDFRIGDPYMGSSARIKNAIRQYGIENFKKDILIDCDSEEELHEAESRIIKECVDDPLCLNYKNGIGWGGIYKQGPCARCGKFKALYHDDLCMPCIKGKALKEWCDVCHRETYRYEDGRCRSCSSRDSHSIEWCDICQSYSTHMGGVCKTHRFYLQKVDGKVQLKKRSPMRTKEDDVVLIPDISIVDRCQILTTPKSTEIKLPDGEYKIKSNDEFVDLKSLIYNNDVSDWLKITYKYDNRIDHARSIIVTSDHPLPIASGKVVHASELEIGDKLIRVNQRIRQYEYAEIISIEPVVRTTRSYDVTTETEYFDINRDILSHNCRSFLSPYLDENGNFVSYSRFNQGVVTINLPAVGLTARGDYDKFWSLLEDKLELCHRALRLRHERLLGTTSDTAPILWQHGAIARLKKGEKIDKLLFGGYSTISLGYAGLCECVKAMMGVSHTTKEGKEFALQIMQKLNDKCNEWKKAENIGYAVYGTPLESTTYKFAKALQKRFGIIPGITDKNYITNSYHVHVTEKIDAFSKLSFESEFQKLSGGGAISYVEIPNLTNNIPAVLELIKFTYNNIQYAEFNTKSDFCHECGYDGEIVIIEENGKLLWECPNCKNRDQTKMSVARRTCGYIGTQFWNQGRTQEIRDRVEHL